VSDLLTDRVTYFHFKSSTIYHARYSFKHKQEVKSMGTKTDELLITLTAIFTSYYSMIRYIHRTLLRQQFNFILVLKDAARVERLLRELAQ